MNPYNLEEIQSVIESANINFLIGAGMSRPYLNCLENIESLLTIFEEDRGQKISEERKSLIIASLYKDYFDGVIAKNVAILENESEAKEVLQDYKNFLISINTLLLKRKNIFSKQANLFTTNIDIFLEKSLEENGFDFNDGFCGRFKPVFNLSNFKKSYFKKSLYYDNTSEIPVFNVQKMHGSLTWQIEGKDIKFSSNLDLINKLTEIKIPKDKIISIDKKDKEQDLIKKSTGGQIVDEVKQFMSDYKEFAIVNPTETKLKDTVLNEIYYGFMRNYSNELEKENTVLFTMGFSFRDQHIRDITLRAADSNPTLRIFIIAHSSNTEKSLRKIIAFDKIKNNNIHLLVPPQKPGSILARIQGKKEDQFEFNLQNIDKEIFSKIVKKIAD
jgi:hypothetical protein